MLDNIDYDALDTADELDLDLESLPWAVIKQQPRKKKLRYGTCPMPVVGHACRSSVQYVGVVVSRGVSIDKEPAYLKYREADMAFKLSEMDYFDDDIQF